MSEQRRGEQEAMLAYLFPYSCLYEALTFIGLFSIN
jgi:hypothetical protein